MQCRGSLAEATRHPSSSVSSTLSIRSFSVASVRPLLSMISLSRFLSVFTVFWLCVAGGVPRGRGIIDAPRALVSKSLAFDDGEASLPPELACLRFLSLFSPGMLLPLSLPSLTPRFTIRGTRVAGVQWLPLGSFYRGSMDPAVRFTRRDARCPGTSDVGAPPESHSSQGFDPSSSAEGQLHRAPSGVECPGTHASKQRFSKCPSGISTPPGRGARESSRWRDFFLPAEIHPLYCRFVERRSLIGTPVSGEFRATWLPGSNCSLWELAIRNPLRMRFVQWDAYHGFQVGSLGNELGTLKCNLLEKYSELLVSWLLDSGMDFAAF